MKTVILGGGITGLVLGYKLGDVLILEREEKVGGLLSSYSIDGFFIEKYYHHFFATDKNLLLLLKELGLKDKILWFWAKTGYFVDGKIYPLNTPIEILKFPPLSFLDKLRLAFFTLRSKFENREKLDKILAKDFVLKTCGKRVFEKFFLPLFKSKFGENWEKISAAWLVSRVALRSNRGLKGEKLGYLKGGFQVFLDSLCKEIKKRGGEIKTLSEVEKIVIEEEKVKGVLAKIEGKEEFIEAERVISTLPPKALKKVLRERAKDFNLEIPFQGACCLILSLKVPLLKDIYWLNIDAKVPFGAIIEHTNLVPAKEYQGQNLVYFASYFQKENDILATLSEQKLFEIFLDGAKKIFPDFKKENINWWKIARTVEAGPIFVTNYKEKVLPKKTKIEGLYLCGMFSKENYPERSLEGAVRAATSLIEDL
jgi:protoporphyrinogen oxidase